MYAIEVDVSFTCVDFSTCRRCHGRQVADTEQDTRGVTSA